MNDVLNDIKENFYALGWQQFRAKSLNTLIYEHDNGFVYKLLISSRLSQGGRLLCNLTVCRKNIWEVSKIIVKKKTAWFGLTHRENNLFMDDRPVNIQVAEWSELFLTLNSVDVFEADERQLFAFEIDRYNEYRKLARVALLVLQKRLDDIKALKYRVDNNDSPFTPYPEYFDPVYLDRAIAECERRIRLGTVER